MVSILGPQMSRAPCGRAIAVLILGGLVFASAALADPRKGGEETGGGRGENTPVVLGANLAVNPTFEAGFACWNTSGAGTIAWVPVGVSGPHSAELVGPASFDEFGINDSPSCVPNVPAAGTRYRISAQVLGDDAWGTARIRVREYYGDERQATEYSSPVLLGPSWQALEMDYVAQRAGSSLDIQILNAPTCFCEGFHVDDIMVCRVLSTNLPPEIIAPASVAAEPEHLMSMDIVATDADGPAIGRLTADLSGFPAGHMPSFTANATHTGGTLTWYPTSAEVSVVPYRVSFTAANSAVRTVRSEILVSPGRPNAALNGGFEVHLGGWARYGNSIITRVPGGSESPWAALVQGSMSLDGFGIDDNPDWVDPVSAQGQIYQFSAQVRSDAAAGKVKLRISEFVDNAQVGAPEYSAAVPLSPAWTPIVYNYVARQAGSRISVRITDYPAAAGESFMVDNIAIVRLPGGSPTGGDTPGGKKGTLALTPKAGIEDGRVRVEPNPARGTATLSLALAVPGAIRVELYDPSGRLVKVLAAGETFSAGAHSFILNEGLSNGMYFYRVRSDQGEQRGRFAVIE